MTARIAGWPRSVWRALKRQWFLVGVVAAILLGYLFPLLGKTNGPIHAEYTIKYGAVMVVFLLSGLGLKSQVLRLAFTHWRAHLLIQCLSLVVIPAIGYGLTKLLSLAHFDEALVAGLVVAVSMPTTISSNVIMTDAAKGNEAVSLINATLGNILGIFVSPLLLLIYLGARTTIDFKSILITMPATVIGPLLVGQFLRYMFPHKVAAAAKAVNFSILSSVALLLLVYSTFADTFSNSHFSVSVGSVFAIIGTICVLYPSFAFFCFLVGRALGFARPDVVSIVFCGSTKTLSLGIPLIGLIYRGDPNLGLYSLPLLVYHATQLFVGGWSVPALRKFVESGPEYRRSDSDDHSVSDIVGAVVPQGNDTGAATVSVDSKHTHRSLTHSSGSGDGGSSSALVHIPPSTPPAVPDTVATTTGAAVTGGSMADRPAPFMPRHVSAEDFDPQDDDEDQLMASTSADESPGIPLPVGAGTGSMHSNRV
ncbi:SBF-like CPA transporter family-domain-containing protein [Blastocladiella britannica]|nr:SBF-like CPA transporter family-domain-containing protein [Blastocladiella britannica]